MNTSQFNNFKTWHGNLTKPTVTSSYGSHFLILFSLFSFLALVSISHPDFRKFMPCWFADKLHWGAERSQGCSSFKNKLLFWVREEYFNCSLSVENIKEPILMEDVKVTESRIMQESNVFNYEKNVVQRLPCSTAQQIICLHKRRHLSRCKSCSCQLPRLRVGSPTQS